MNTRQIGRHLRFRRISLELRQEDLAEMSGVTTRTIGLIESGTGNPSLETLQKLATVLGMELVVRVIKVTTE